MIVKRISLIGNSVGLRKRPPMQHPKNKSYGEILEDLLNIKLEDLFLVNNCSLHRATIKDILKKIDFYIRDFPDYYIINIGVVDATTREIPYWFSNLKDHSKDRFKRLTYILNAIHFHIFKRFRPLFIKIRREKTWISAKKFELYIEELIRSLLKETNAKIIIIPINKGNERIEKQAPGSLKNYQKYNIILKKLAIKYEANFIDLQDLNSENHFPDGIHFSVEGHKKIAQKIYNTFF